MMTFRVVHKPSNNHVRCPYRLIEEGTGREIHWINQYLDYEMLRRLADTTLRTYAHGSVAPTQRDSLPDLPRGYAEAEGNAILTFLQLLNQFNSGQYLSDMSEQFEAKHG